MFINKRVKSIWINCESTVYCKHTKESFETLGLSSESRYNNLDRIKKNLYIEEVFKKLNATVINTEYKSIEESRFYIEKFYNLNCNCKNKEVFGYSFIRLK